MQQRPRMGKNEEDLSGLHLGKLEKRRLLFFQVYLNLYKTECHL